MAATRKLQAEIQQTLKKVDEGVLIFDEIWEKVYSATQQTLKEKYETDLKKEIKKLQRLRDQIKTWLSSSEIKDKNSLLEARKTIENKMEQFKICEKDTKTKAYSKEGLAREAKLDPKEALREEKRQWINECLERLSDLINTVEADEEKITSAKGKPTKAQKDQLEKYRNRMIKHKWHETRLELIIKLLDSDDLDPSRLDDVKDSLEYYLDNANEDDGAVGVEDEFDIYEELDLDSIAPEGAVEAIAAKIGAIDITRAEEEAAAAAALAAAAAAAKEASDAAEAEEKKKAAAAKTTKATATKTEPVKTTPPPAVVAPTPVVAAPAAKTLPAGKTAASVVASTLPAAATAPAATAAAKPPALTAKADVKKATTSTGATSVSLASIVSSLNTTPSLTAEDGAKESSETVASSAGAPAPVSWATAAAASQPTAPAPATKSATPASVTTPPVAAATPTPPAPSLIPATQSAAITPASASATPVVPQPVPAAAPLPKAVVAASPVIAAMNSPAVSASTASIPPSPAPSLLSQQPPPLQQKLSPDMMNTLNMLKQSMTFAPESMEDKAQPSYTPRNYYQHTHPSYPTVPLFATQAENTAWFERLPMDTLFFVFYFQQGTYQQYLAAKQLKKHSWRFHKKYMTWFQRHEEPKIATEEYEEGTYVYFDYESGWCQRIKSEFKFEYAYLEDELSSGGGGGPIAEA